MITTTTKLDYCCKTKHMKPTCNRNLEKALCKLATIASMLNSCNASNTATVVFQKSFGLICLIT